MNIFAPPKFRQTDDERLFDCISQWEFATLVSVINGELYTSQLPFLLSEDKQQLVGHLANANKHTQALLNADPSMPSTHRAIFHGPHGYISPRSYSNPSVPTWNYASVLVEGKISVRTDKENFLQRLTRRYETDPNHPALLQPGQADYERLLEYITVFELSIDELVGKFKLSQNKTPEEQQTIIDNLKDSANHTNQALAKLMQMDVLTKSE